MHVATPLATFGDLVRDQLVSEVTCPNCSHWRTIDDNFMDTERPRRRRARFR
jgi:hypothetical protein